MGVPSISGWEWFFMFLVIGVVGWAGISGAIWIIKFLVNHLQWV